MTLGELEGAINALQDELDVLRADARRAFTVSAGHALADFGELTAASSEPFPSRHPKCRPLEVHWQS